MSRRHLCGTDIYIDRVRGFLSVRCVIVELLESSGLCVPVEIDSVEVARQGDDSCWCGGRFVVQAVPVRRYQVVYCVAVNM